MHNILNPESHELNNKLNTIESDYREHRITAKQTIIYIILAWLAGGMVYPMSTPLFWKQMHWLIPAIIIICGLAIPLFTTAADVVDYSVRALYSGLIICIGTALRSGILYMNPDILMTLRGELTVWIIALIGGFTYGMIMPYMIEKYNLTPRSMPRAINRAICKAIKAFCKSCTAKLQCWKQLLLHSKANANSLVINLKEPKGQISGLLVRITKSEYILRNVTGMPESRGNCLKDNILRIPISNVAFSIESPDATQAQALQNPQV